MNIYAKLYNRKILGNVKQNKNCAILPYGIVNEADPIFTAWLNTKGYIAYSSVAEHIYVDGTTGSDVTGDGTISSPYATIQHALDTITRLKNNDYIQINIGDGTYVENLVIPSSYSGNVKLIGNTTTRSNVVIQGDGTTNIIFANSKSQNIYVAGIRFIDSGIYETIKSDGANIYITDNLIEIYNGSGIEVSGALLNTDDTATSINIDNNNVPYATGINILAGGSAAIRCPIVIDKCYIGLRAIRSELSCGGSVGRGVTINLSTNGYAAAQAYGNAYLAIYGNINIDGKNALGCAGISVSTRSVFFLTSGAYQFNISNCTNGILALNNSSLGGTDPLNLVFTNCTIDTYFGYSTIVQWSTALTPTYFDEGTYGYDNRFSSVSSGTSAPSSTPSKVGDIYIDTNNRAVYISVGTTNSSDWIKLN